MEIAASNRSRFVTDGTTVRIDRMKWTVRVCPRAAITAAITTLAVYQTPSCATARKTAPMGLTRKSVVGDIK